MKLVVSVVGLGRTIAELKQFGNGFQRLQTRKALAAAGGVIRDEAVKRAPVQTGTLKKNITVKTKVPRDPTKAYALVGAKRGVKVAVTTKNGAPQVVARFRTKKDGTIAVSGQKKLDKLQASGKQVKYRVPSRYLHLAEKHKRFMAASVAAKGQAAGQAAIDKLNQGVNDEAAKARRA